MTLSIPKAGRNQERSAYLRMVVVDVYSTCTLHFLIQRQFEMPDDDKVYIESHNENYIGHFHINRATLQTNKIYIELNRREYSNIQISFKVAEKVFQELSDALKTMIPNINIKC